MLEPADALIDLDDAAAVLGLPPAVARVYLDSQQETPVASYHGRPLWLSDTVHDMAGDQ